MTGTGQFGLLQTIEELLRDEGWREIALESCDDGFMVEARHEGDPTGGRVAFGLGPVDLEAIVRMAQQSA
ncbi:MAG TPA: hypothetical protein VIL85_23600 [Thermomicrobiales bacterium]|jgi:hypothetical protein